MTVRGTLELRQDPEERFIRACPRHRLPLRVFLGVKPGEGRNVLLCPRHHAVRHWLVVDVDTGAVVAVGSLNADAEAAA